MKAYVIYDTYRYRPKLFGVALEKDKAIEILKNLLSKHFDKLSKSTQESYYEGVYGDEVNTKEKFIYYFSHINLNYNTVPHIEEIELV